MRKLFSGFLIILSLFLTIIPSVDATARTRYNRNQYSPPVNLYSQNPSIYSNLQNQNNGYIYYFSPTYVSGYTYYSSPTPGYYYYLGTTAVNNSTPQYNNTNSICTIINNVYQCTNSIYVSSYSVYPGCSNSDIIIGGQIWASCNALDTGEGSASKSGWFFAGDSQSSFASYNGN